MPTNVSMSRGDTVSFPGVVSDDSGVVNISTATFRFTAKADYAEADNHAAIVKTATAGGIQIIDGPTGRFQINLTPADTASLPAVTVKLLYDVQMTIGSVVSTVAKGVLTIDPDVSITVP